MGSRRKTVVVADDDQAFARYLAAALDRFGFDVIPAENGLEVIHLLKIFNVDAVMLDVQMPVMDGIEALKRIKEDSRTSGLPMIVMSSDSGDETAAKCKNDGCLDYLVKPVSLQRLHEILRNITFPEKNMRRRHLRVTTKEKVTVVADGASYELFTENLSERGIYVAKEEPLPAGTPVEVTLLPKGEEKVTLRGVVVYTRRLPDTSYRIPPGMAIVFEDIADDASEILKGYVTDSLAIDFPEEK